MAFRRVSGALNLAVGLWPLRNKCPWCGASCLLAPLRPREARVNNSRHNVGGILGALFSQRPLVCPFSIQATDRLKSVPLGTDSEERCGSLKFSILSRANRPSPACHA